MMAFSEDDKDRLYRHWKTIKNNVEMKYIVDVLIEERVISPDEWEDMKKSHPLEKDRTEAFLHLLLKQSERSYDAFLKALQNGRYDFISEKLDRNMKRNQPLADQPTHFGGGRQDMDDDSFLNPRNFRLLWEKVNNDGEKTRRKLEALNKEIEECKCALRKKEKEIKKLQEKYQEKEEDYSNLRQTLERQNTEITNAEEQMKAVESKLKKAEQEVERLQRENAQKEEDYSKLNQTLERQKREIIDVKEQMEDVESKFERAEQEVQRLERENTQKEGDYSNLNQTLQRQRTEIMTVKEQMGNVESKLKEAEMEVERLQRENTQLSRQSTFVDGFNGSGANAQDFRQRNTIDPGSKQASSPEGEASTDSIRRAIAYSEKQTVRRKRTKDEIEERNKESTICCLQ